MVYQFSIPSHIFESQSRLITGTNKVLDLHLRGFQQWQPKVRATHSDLRPVCVCLCVQRHFMALLLSVQCLLPTVCSADGGLQTLINKCDTSCTVPDRGVSWAGRCIGQGQDRGLV